MNLKELVLARTSQQTGEQPAAQVAAVPAVPQAFQRAFESSPASALDLNIKPMEAKKVHMIVAQGVTDFDLGAAMSALEACSVAGVDITLIPKVLNTAYGYPVTETVTNEPFQQLSTQAVGGFQRTATQAVAWNNVEDTSHLLQEASGNALAMRSQSVATYSVTPTKVVIAGVTQSETSAVPAPEVAPSPYLAPAEPAKESQPQEDLAYSPYLASLIDQINKN